VAVYKHSISTFFVPIKNCCKDGNVAKTLQSPKSGIIGAGNPCFWVLELFLGEKICMA